MIVDGLVKLAGLGLVVAGFNVGTTAFLGFDFLSQTPEAFRMFTALGALIGGVDSGVWYLTGENLLS